MCVVPTKRKIDQMDSQDRINIVFEKIWQNFTLDKARLRSLSEKDKMELKGLMKTIFMSSLEAGSAVDEAAAALKGLSLNINGSDKEEVESTVRSVVKEELGEIAGLLREIKDKPATVINSSSGSQPGYRQDTAVVVDLHSAMFDTDMKTNIDDVSVEGKEVTGVKSNLDALRRLMGK
jgi:hypothetical protein